jgi:hypothetical protein
MRTIEGMIDDALARNIDGWDGMTPRFISIVESDTYTDLPRTSTLAISKTNPDVLEVVGILPHGYLFRPKTAKDRDALVHFLNNLEYGDKS